MMRSRPFGPEAGPVLQAASFIAGVIALTALGWWTAPSPDSAVGFWPSAGLLAGFVAGSPRSRKWAVPSASIATVAVALWWGVAPAAALTIGVAVAVEAVVAASVFRRRHDPLTRPETSMWMVGWMVAAGAGALAGSVPAALAGFLSGESPLAWAAAWCAGHVAGMVLVAPAFWGAGRWFRSAGWRHQSEVRRFVVAAMVAVVSLVVAVAGIGVTGRPEFGLAPLPILGWLALNAGYRATAVISAAVGTGLLAGWSAIGRNTSDEISVAVHLFVLVAHIAVVAISIEASARWHARALLAGVVDVAVESVIVVDADGRIMTANPAAYDLFGFRHLEGMPAADVLPDLESAHNSAGPVEMLGNRSDGAAFHAEVSSGPIEAPGRPIRAVVCRDTSADRETKEALSRAAEILDATPDFVAWTDVDGRILHVNEGGRRMVGLDSGVGPGSVEWHDVAAGDTVRQIHDVAIPTARTDGAWKGEAVFLRDDGTEVPVSLLVLAHTGEDGEVRYLSTMARDVSERYEIDQMKDQFVSNFTHELRSPLTGILGYLELMSEGAFGDLPSDAVEAVGMLQEDAGQLMELVNDLLSMWRAEHHSGAVERQPVVVADLVQNIIHSIEPVAARKHVEVNLVDRGGEVLAAKRDLERAILNVASNAVKFTPEGGKVTISVEQVDGRVRLSVADTGIGIAAAEVDAVFDRFFRASSAEEANIPGTGLGLPIVRHVADSHGGSVRMESVLGHGTFVILELPALGAESSQEAPPIEEISHVDPAGPMMPVSVVDPSSLPGMSAVPADAGADTD